MVVVAGGQEFQSVITGRRYIASLSKEGCNIVFTTAGGTYNGLGTLISFRFDNIQYLHHLDLFIKM